VQDGHDIVFFDESADFAAWVMRPLRERGHRDRFGSPAPETAKKYDGSTIAPRFENILAELASISLSKCKSSKGQQNVCQSTIVPGST
jgi:hypothetical protein